MTLASDSMRQQKQIRAAVSERVSAALSDLACPVLRSREQPAAKAREFVNVYFLRGDVDLGRGHLDTSGSFVVRIATRNAASIEGKAQPVDDELSDLGAMVLDALQEDETLGGLVESFVLKKWAYAEPEGSSITFLGLEFNVEYQT